MDTLAEPTTDVAAMEAALQQLLIERIMPCLPEVLENSAEGIADCLVDAIQSGTSLDDLDLNGHIESWLEDRR